MRTDSAGIDAVSEIVSRCRRRMRLVAAARCACLTIPLAVVAVEIVAFAARPTPAHLAMWTAAAGAIAAAAAARVAILRGPTLREAATEIDARLRLQDRVVTALHVLHDRDPMARLVLRDAEARLANMSPHRTFPLEAPSNFAAMLLAIAVSAVVLLLTVAAPGRLWRTTGTGATGTAGAGPGRPGSPAKPGMIAQTVEGAAPSTSERLPRESTETAAQRDEAPIGRERPADTQTQANARSGSGPRAGADARTALSDRDAGSAAGVHDGARGATGFSDEMAPAAGGVNGAQRSTARPAPPPTAAATAPSHAAYRDRYRIAAARAESAVAQERVPMHLRTYVRRYFVAIHP